MGLKLQRALPRSVDISAVGIVLGCIVLRLLIEASLWHQGWFFGSESDPFSRTFLSWVWARHPYIYPGHWLPLQFWLVGALYRVFGVTRADLLVPVVLNQFVFAISLTVLYWTTRKLAGTIAAAIACILAATLAVDIWVSFNALSEPITVLSGMLFAGLALGWLDLAPQQRIERGIAISFVAFVAALNHYVGWALAILALAMGIYGVQWSLRNGVRLGARGRGMKLVGSIVFAAVVPLAWSAFNEGLYARPLHFLTRAAQYHAQYAPNYSVNTRLFATFGLWASSSPVPIVLGFIGFALAAIRSPKRAAEIGAPFLALAVLLEVSSITTWAMPYLYTRYTVVLTWLLLPFAGFLVANMRLPTQTWRVKVASIVVVAGATVGIVKVHKFENWVSPDVRNVSSYLANVLAADQLTERVVVESYGNWLDQGIDVVTGFPDQFIFVSHEIPVNKADWREDCKGACLYVVRDFDTLASMGDEVGYAYSSGNWMVLRPDSAAGLLGGMDKDAAAWAAVSDEFYLLVPPSTVVFGYREPDPEPQSLAAIYDTVETGSWGCVDIGLEAGDFYDVAEWPGRFVHQVVLNDSVVWTHDVSGDTSSGWQALAFRVAPRQRAVRVEARIAAVGTPELRWEWGRASRMGVRNLVVSPCDG